MTKTKFLTLYRAELVARYSWASDTAKLDRFMQSVSDTIHGSVNTWNNDGEAVISAWKQIGGKGKPTYKALRALE